MIEWQRQRSIEPPADASWIELGCRFNGQEDGLAPELVVLAPASRVSVGDRINVEGTAPLDVTVPLDPGEGPPVSREVATQLVLNEDGWEARCAPAAAGQCSFHPGPDGLAVIEVFRGPSPGWA